MKIKSFIILFIVFLIIVITNKTESTTYQVLEITDDCKIGIDINKNGSVSDDEFFEIKDITPFCSAENFKKNEKYTGEITDKNTQIFLEQSTLDLYKKLFLNSPVRIQEGNIKVNFQNAAITILKSGLAFTDNPELKIYENTKKFESIKNEGKTKDFRLLNLKSYKYHKLDCKKGITSANKRYVPFNELPKRATPCGYCINNNIETSAQNAKASNLIEKNFTEGQIKIIETIGAEVYKPSEACDTTICKSLKKEIDNAKQSIDMAVYELRGQPQIVSALIAAKNRGVKIRVATDNSNKNCFTDLEPKKQFAEIISDDSKPEKHSLRLMHNKFFIFDNETVWTGSTNITNTGITGFNTNSAILIRSKDIANLYKKEFENFMQNKYHNTKPKTEKNDCVVGKSRITVLFSPQDKPITTALLPAVKNAEKYIYLPIFILTHKELTAELINAKKRGVDVKIITDAASAANKYSLHNELRANNIPVKIENFAGKMHMKSIIIDDKTAFLGSMNFTKSGNQYNDENCIKIENPEIAKYLKANFLLLWQKIPNEYLTKIPKAESPDSIGSCFDGIDNDHDGLIDSADFGCKASKAK